MAQPANNQPTLEDRILADMRKYNYPITAQFVGKHIGEIKKTVNGELYRMQKRNVVKRLECNPPLWQIIQQDDNNE